MTKKNENNNTLKDQQSLIPEDSEDKPIIDKTPNIKGQKSIVTQDRWFVPLKWDDLVTTLARAFISPIDSYPNNDNLQIQHRGQILIRKNGISITKPLSEGLNDFIVLVELDINSLPIKLITGINNKGVSENISSTNDLNQYDILLFLGAIAVSNIRCIHFHLTADKDNFVSRSYDNHPNNKTGKYDFFKLEVSNTLFEYKLPKKIENYLKKNSIPPLNIDFSDLFHRSNCFLGSIALLLEVMPLSQNWLNFIKKIFAAVGTKNLITYKDFDLGDDPFEQKLFDFTLNKMILSSSNDMQGKKFLENLVKEVENDLDQSQKDTLKGWYETTLAILNNERDLPKLTDEKSKVGRAILLVLVRPRYEDILSSKNSILEPGDDVMALASILIGAKYGFATLVNHYKSKESNYYIYSNKIVDLFNADLSKQISEINLFEPIIKEKDITIQNSNVSDLDISYKIYINNRMLVEKVKHGPDELAKVLINSRSSSEPIHFDADREKMRLSCEYSFENGRHQKVYVSVGKATKHGNKTIRVWSPCLNFQKPSKAYNFELLDAIMKMHSFPETYCRIGLSEDQKELIVMRDQMVESSGNIELEMIENVARFADDFENQYTHQDKY